ncbi:MAG: HAMP domain-containing sensor histidine kinase, partial [Acidobacteriota bacterium]
VADLDVIVEQIDRLHDTTREILGLARPRSGEPVDLAELVHSAHYVLQAEARKRGVDVRAAEIQPFGTVPGSAAAWQTVVFNLMLNAIEHTPAGQTIDVSLTCDDGAPEGGTSNDGTSKDSIVFTTSNPGQPLDAETERRIFEPFISQGGTGLGLPLVARRVSELGGSIEVHSQAGQIRFEVRVAQAAGTPAADASNGPEPASSTEESP